jgi:hypothetical protein
MRHHCHWTGCPKEVPPSKWGCKKHWFTLPRHLQLKLSKAYVPGQEVTKTPSAEYIQVAREIQDWIAANGEKRQPVVRKVGFS